jgi:AP-3 complex subunit sigma
MAMEKMAFLAFLFTIIYRHLLCYSRQVSSRPDSFCNYLEGIVPEWGENIKLIYRHYATLYFVFAVDAQESDLGILDLIQVFVEALDKCFENVCELDLIFHSDRVHYVLDEIVMGGMVLETNISAILQSIKECVS